MRLSEKVKTFLYGIGLASSLVGGTIFGLARADKGMIISICGGLILVLLTDLFPTKY
jgi:hypothetical protein